MHKIRQRFLLRRCRGCADASPHSHHFTRAGRRRYAFAEKPSITEMQRLRALYERQVYGTSHVIVEPPKPDDAASRGDV